MAIAIRMPKMSDTMTEGVIAQWLKKEGDTIKAGDILAEVETDKATMELENFEDGILLHIAIPKGKPVPIDGIIAIIGQKGDDFKALLLDDSIKKPESKTEESTIVTPVQKSQKEKPNINAVVVRMPKMSDTMTEGTIAQWLKNVGDNVKSGDILAEVETDKATMELENYEEGILLYQGVEKGKAVLVNGVLAIVGEKGADFKALLAYENQGDNEIIETKEEEKQEISPRASLLQDSDTRLKASPLAKELARNKNIDLQQIKGSGEYGRIVKRDIENFVPLQKTVSTSKSTIVAPVISGQESFEDFPLSQMRKTIARRLSESKFSAPEFYLTMEIVMDKAIEARGELNTVSPIKISFNDFVIKAVALSLTKHPVINSHWMGDKIRQNHHISIGMAVAVEEGLLVPVIRFANTKSLGQIASEAKDLATKAKNKQLQPKDWEGSTFSISNLGMFGIDEFTAIINPPDSCILAVGGIKETVRAKNGQFIATSIMKVTLTCDHRVVDGASGAAFLQTLKNYLENPIQMVL